MQAFHALTQFERIFYLIIAALILAVNISMWRFVAQWGQRHHLFWIIPWFIDDLIDLIYRITDVIHMFGFWNRSLAVFAVLHICSDIAVGFDLLGVLMLFQVLKAGRLPELAAVSDPEAWPPPPRA